jgi:uncharacterized protein YPO0396
MLNAPIDRAALQALLEHGLADQTYETVTAMEAALKTMVEVLDDSGPDGGSVLLTRTRRARQAMEDLVVALEGGDGAPRVNPQTAGGAER